MRSKKTKEQIIGDCKKLLAKSFTNETEKWRWVRNKMKTQDLDSLSLSQARKLWGKVVNYSRAVQNGTVVRGELKKIAKKIKAKRSKVRRRISYLSDHTVDDDYKPYFYQSANYHIQCIRDLAEQFLVAGGKNDYAIRQMEWATREENRLKNFKKYIPKKEQKRPTWFKED